MGSCLTDEHWMQLALEQAQAAASAGEVPVGAVVVRQGELISHGSNQPIQTHDPSAHAEMVALRRAAQRLGNYRLPDCELFVTLEPCVMCAGALLQARLRRVVFGASDPKSGAAGSVLDVFDHPALNHHTQLRAGVLQQPCADELQRFFGQQRRQQAQQRRLTGAALRDDALRTPQHCFSDLAALAITSCWVHDLPVLSGLRLHYLDTQVGGNEQALVYLHGPDAWCCAWRTDLAEALAQGRRALCPDLIGYGQSDKPKKESVHTFAWHANYLRQWLHGLGLDHITLVSPVAMLGLARVVQQMAGSLIDNVRVGQPAALTAQQRDAPFPDNG
ncbi:MAG: tRNA adenosine(34) deaminase TadA, partial [Rhodoferax sp.]|nr:tRNA adenosine(34) deaminase TadA [Rhodoferax sp.]